MPIRLGAADQAQPSVVPAMTSPSMRLGRRVGGGARTRTMETAAADASRGSEMPPSCAKRTTRRSTWRSACSPVSFALPETTAARSHLIGLIWGVTVGLAAAHWFVFRLSTRLVGAGTVRSQDMESAGPQVLGAAVVAVLTSIPIVFLPATLEYPAVQFDVAAF